MTITANQLIRVGHSPDPDDAFMFYALAKQKIPMGGLRVEHVIEDIESLNQKALQAELEVTAVSCHAYAYLYDQYLVMRSGASVGDQYGPILIAPKLASPSMTQEENQSRINGRPDIRGKKIAIPGKLTTAYLALQLYERDFVPVFIPFDQIFEAVLHGDADLGLVIHEGQLTFHEKKLTKLLDLGRWWHDETGLPLPLGIDIIRRDLGEKTIRSFSDMFKSSIEYALEHRQEALEYALRFGRGIGQPLGDQFVGMYVNHFTVDLGESGEKGLRRLYIEGYKAGLLPHPVQIEFV